MSATMDDLVLLILSAPSGAGKTTLARNLLLHLPDFTFSVSHTTRRPRPGEVEGREYHFVERGEFERLVASGEFAEWAEVHGNLYGTSVREIERARADGKRGIVFDIDYQGARQIKAKLRDAVSLFVLPPNIAELRRRLEARGSEDSATVERRFRAAWSEIEHYGMFDYVIVNDDLDRAIAAFVSIARAEQQRRWRFAQRAEELLRERY